MSQPLLDSFYLVGGTALALQLGHRFSIDLDFFTHHDFDKDVLFDNFKENYDIAIELTNPVITIAYINEVKTDFVKVRYSPQYPIKIIEGVKMLDIRDIAPMKLNAISQRGSKKDFYDIYYLFNHISLEEMLVAYEVKFKTQNMYQVVKSLTYFTDADEFTDPIVFDKNLTWSKIKKSISKTVDSYLT
jgi:predicted nucleotidyltransferase component of viral defense system